MNMYLLLYSGGGMPETEEETNAMTDAWGAWLAGYRRRPRGRQPLHPQREEPFA